MSDNHDHSRRSVIKKGALSVTAGAGLIAGSQSVAASKDGELTINGNGWYRAIVTDPDATADDADEVTSRNGETWIESSINGGTHKAQYDGYVRVLTLDGATYGWTFGDDHVTGDITVEGDNTDYAIGVTYRLEKDGEEVDNPYVDTLWSQETFEAIGPMNEFDVFGEGRVTYTYTR